jgi:hypothetical protein
VPVGDDDHEVNDQHEDDEVNDRGDERAEVYERRRVMVLAQLNAQADGVAALRPCHDRFDDGGGEGGNQGAERESYGKADSHHDDVAAHEEVPESLEHVDPPWPFPG